MVLRVGLRVFSNPAWMGGVHYVLTWARALRRLPEVERPWVCLLPAEKAGEEIARQHAALVDDVRPFAEAPRLGLDLVYPATQVFEAPFETPWAAWIPDWQCRHMPEMFDDLERARRDVHYRLLATRAPLLVLSSRMAFEDTERAVGAELVPTRLLPFPAFLQDAARRAPAEALAEVRRRHRLPERFFLVANQFWKHKNHRVVLEALALLGGTDVVCAFTGDTTDHRWPKHFRELEAFIDAHGLGPRVRLLGRIPREDQLLLMRAAVAVIQPSLFEGWSSVVEECRALGQRTLLSDFPVHVEQSPPGARFFPPRDAGALARLMREAWAENAHRASGRLEDGLTAGHATHDAYVLECARQLVDVARAARAAYDPARHDPKNLLIDLLERVQAARASSPTAEALFHRIVKGTRARLATDLEQAAAFRTLGAERAPALAAVIDQVVPPGSARAGEVRDRSVQYAKRPKLRTAEPGASRARSAWQTLWAALRGR